jgi:NitT/TauT family transport system substrate-binding protein
MTGRRFLLLSLFILITSIAFAQINPESSAQPQKSISLRVGTWKTAQTITPFFYEQFLNKGDEVKVFPFTNPGDQKTALLAGSLDITGTTIVHAITSAARGEPIVLVCALCDKCSALVVRKGAGIHKPGDLRGKKIGYVPSTMHDVLLRETLIKAGLDPAKDVTLLRVDFFDMGQALARGSIDAFLSGEPYPTLAVVRGYGDILTYPYYDDSIGPINAGMIVTRDLIAKRRDLVQAAVNAHSRATQYLTGHPDQWLKRAENFGNQPEILRESAKNMALVWKMDDEYIRRAKTLGKRMQALGMIDRQPDYDQLFDLSFLEQAQNELMND